MSIQKTLLITLAVFGSIILLIAVTGIYKFNFTNDDIYFACTEEAKICPDGSAVGRTGSDCEFAVCPANTSPLSEAEAKIIAEKTCIKGGETLGAGYYNENSKTWWFDANLNATKPGCNPACVVSEETKAAEINWRCTGLISPTTSGITGSVLLGPTCPVMRDPPDPQCADKPYQSTIQVIEIGSSKSSPFATIKTDNTGSFKLTLPPGKYSVQVVSSGVFPRCESKEVTITKDTITEVNVYCDTGIR